MLILISLAPGYFAINPNTDITKVQQNIVIVQSAFEDLDMTKISPLEASKIEEIKESIGSIKNIVTKNNIEDEERIAMRKHILKVQKEYKTLSQKEFNIIPKASANE